ncbi:aldose 1-epimerase [Nocardiopsis mwathae]|uniref:Aldose 1-epimerase n=1 Tax=Nocardiopsis mwathae TaxID=1472723 RepID=A0A7W9YHY0_9ACTN|nr:aldose 1-epimerase [Nocardiopsis mwathae]
MSEAVELVAGDYRAVIGRGGAALQRLTWCGEDLVWDGVAGSGSHGVEAFQGRLMAPWPNRVDKGRYTFQGAEYQLDITEPERGTAIHGLVHSRPWTVVDADPAHARLCLTLDGEPGYPFPLELAADYRLDPALGLTVNVAARNVGPSAAPYGFGAHPYLTVGVPLDEATLHLPARLRQPVDDRLLPTGPPQNVAGTDHDFRAPRRVGATRFDTAFTGLRPGAEGRSWTVLSGPDRGVGLWADATCGWLQVFSADGLPGGAHRCALAVEPMTCPPNALATGRSLRVLEPGQRSEAHFGIRRMAPAPAPD